jgi:hypothetical protein
MFEKENYTIQISDFGRLKRNKLLRVPGNYYEIITRPNPALENGAFLDSQYLETGTTFNMERISQDLDVSSCFFWAEYRGPCSNHLLNCSIYDFQTFPFNLISNFCFPHFLFSHICNIYLKVQ